MNDRERHASDRLKRPTEIDHERTGRPRQGFAIGRKKGVKQKYYRPAKRRTRRARIGISATTGVEETWN